MDTNKVAQILADSASNLVKVAQERDLYKTRSEKLAEENAALLRRMDAEKVAMDMVEKGMNTDVQFDVLVNSLEKKAQEDPEHFRILKEAVGLTGPDMFKTASIGSKTTAQGGSDFERFILGDVG